MARGADSLARPVVATAVGGGPEAVMDGATGLLVPSGDPAPPADRIAAILDAPARAHAMGRAGRDRTEAMHATLVSWRRSG